MHDYVETDAPWPNLLKPTAKHVANVRNTARRTESRKLISCRTCNV